MIALGTMIAVVIVFRLHHKLMVTAGVPNEDRSMLVNGYEIHHIASGSVVLLLLGLAAQVAPRMAASTVFAAAVGGGIGMVGDQVVYYSLLEVSDASYGSTFSLVGSLTFVLIYAVLICVLHSRTEAREATGAGVVEEDKSISDCYASTRMLSHRIRGFGGPEGSLHNLREAIRSGVRLIEIDTRHTADQEIVVHHSPCLTTLTDGRDLICELPWRRVSENRFREKPDEGLARLSDVLDVVARHAGVELWVDMKDYGIEERYVREIRAHGLEGRVRLISWIPQSLFRLAALGSGIPLGFCYSCAAGHPLWHKFLRRLMLLFGKQSKPLCPGRRGWLVDQRAAIPSFHPLIRRISPTVPPEYAVGYNHGHVIPGLPSVELQSILRDNQGAIGMFPSQATPDIVQEAHRKGLAVYVYCIDDARLLESFLARSPVDVVFTNNPELAIRQPEGTPCNET